MRDRITSRWPLPPSGVRYITPPFLLESLRSNPLTTDLHPLALGYYPHAAAHQMRRRSHATELLIYCTAGWGQLRLDGAVWPVGAGDLIVLPAGTAHSYAADAESPWTIYWAHYGGSKSGLFTDYLKAPQPVVRIGLQPRVMAGFEGLFHPYRSGFAFDAFVLGAGRLRLLLTELAGSTARDGADERLDLDHLLDFIEQNMHRQLDLATLAAEAKLSRFHFIRRFKALTGHAPIQHLIHLKMQRACRLLDSSDEPVKGVAARLGYEDPYYFSRLFKRVIGVAPQHWRDHHPT